MEKWIWIGIAAGALYVVAFILIYAIRWTGQDRFGWLRWLSMIGAVILSAIFLEDVTGINMFIIGAVLLIGTGALIGTMTNAAEKAYKRKHHKEA